MLRWGLPRHSRRWAFAFTLSGLHASIFLRPLAPRALPRFLATMDALTPPGRLFGPLGHEHRSVPGGSPCLSRPRFQPFCPQPPHRPSHGICSRSRFSSARGRRPEDPAPLMRAEGIFPQGSCPGLRSALAGSPVGLAVSGLRCFMSCMMLRYGRVVHLRQLPTPCCHDAVAFGHRRVNFRLTGTSTPPCGRLRRRTSAAFTPLPPWTALGLWAMPGSSKSANTEAA